MSINITNTDYEPDKNNPFKKHRYNRADYEFDRAKREADQKVKNALREKFKESERILNLLRTQGAATLQAATEEEVETWAKVNQISDT